MQKKNSVKEKESVIFTQSLFSGILIGIGDVINLSCENRYVGAMLFSLALLTIIHHAIPLYTGRIGFVRDFKLTYLLKVLVYNLVGVVIPVLMVSFCRENFFEAAKNAGAGKFSNGYLELFFLGMLCGVLMLVAVYTKEKLITVFCIMVFILSGYEHCIADFPFFVLNFSPENLIKFLCIVLGNSAGSIISYELIRKENPG